jgi:hypothetical protein
MLLLNRLQGLAATMLDLPQTTMMDVEQPLQELGMDPLIAVNLRTSVAELTGENRPVTVVFDYPSLSRMADYLLDTVLHLSESASASPCRVEDPALAWEIDALSEPEAAERLSRALSRFGR